MANAVKLQEVTGVSPSRQGRKAQTSPEAKAIFEGVQAGKTLRVTGEEAAKIVRQAQALGKIQNPIFKVRTFRDEAGELNVYAKAGGV